MGNAEMCINGFNQRRWAMIVTNVLYRSSLFAALLRGGRERKRVHILASTTEIRHKAMWNKNKTRACLLLLLHSALRFLDLTSKTIAGLSKTIAGLLKHVQKWAQQNRAFSVHRVAALILKSPLIPQVWAKPLNNDTMIDLGVKVFSL